MKRARYSALARKARAVTLARLKQVPNRYLIAELTSRGVVAINCVICGKATLKRRTETQCCGKKCGQVLRQRRHRGDYATGTLKPRALTPPSLA